MMWFSLLFACGDKCPEGYEVNDEEKACYPIEDGNDSDTNSTDTGNTNPDDTADTDIEDTGEEAIDPFDSLDTLNGKIIIPGLFEGRLIPRNAFWYQVDDKALVYMTANRSATCELVANHLNPDATAMDPSDLFILDHCNMGIVLHDVNDLSSASYFSECTFGTGSFSQQGATWKWTGTDENGINAEYFVGAGLVGDTFDWMTDGDRIAVDVAVTEWAGNFPYSTTDADNDGRPDYNTSGAVGTGSGYIIAGECAALTESTYLRQDSNPE